MASDNQTPEQSPEQSPESVRALLRITCADAGALLSDYHDDTLGPDDRARMAAHLGGCVACGVILEQIGTTVVVLRTAGSGRAAPASEDIDALLAAVLGGRGPR